MREGKQEAHLNEGSRLIELTVTSPMHPTLPTPPEDPCFSLNTVCLDRPSAVAMADRLGGLALPRASLMRSNVARS